MGWQGWRKIYGLFKVENNLGLAQSIRIIQGCKFLIINNKVLEKTFSQKGFHSSATAGRKGTLVQLSSTTIFYDYPLQLSSSTTIFYNYLLLYSLLSSTTILFYYYHLQISSACLQACKSPSLYLSVLAIMYCY